MQYRYAVNCAGMTPASEIVEHIVVLPLLPMMPCGGAIRDVMTGKRTAKAKNLRLKTASIKNTA